MRAALPFWSFVRAWVALGALFGLLLGAGSLLGALTGVDVRVRGFGLELSGWRAGVANLVRGPLFAGAAFAACAPLVYLGLWATLRLIERFTAALRSDSDSR